MVIATSVDIDLTKAAEQKIAELIAEYDAEMCFRVQIVGGGCQGFKYDFSLDEQSEIDYQKKFSVVSLIVDEISLQYLHGVTIDYECNGANEAFSVNNPNALTTCSCGSSFSTGE